MNLADHVVIRAPQDAGYPASVKGPAYTYELAANGVFLEAYKAGLGARIPLAALDVRGLDMRLEPFLAFDHGRVPASLLELAVGIFASTPDRERYCAIVWEEGYDIRLPVQEGEGFHVAYETIPNAVVNLHSHPPGLPAAFSGTDDRDDKGFGVAVVVAELDRLIPVARTRVYMYGYFWEIPLSQVFWGPLGVRGPDDDDGWRER